MTAASEWGKVRRGREAVQGEAEPVGFSQGDGKLWPGAQWVVESCGQATLESRHVTPPRWQPGTLGASLMQGAVLFAGENLNGRSRNSHHCTSGPTLPRVTGVFQVTVFVSEGCLNQLSQTEWPKATEIYSLPVLEARNPKSGGQQGHTPCRGSGGGSFSALPASGGSWCSLACGSLTPISPGLSSCVSPSSVSYKDSLTELGPILVQHDLTSILPLLICAKILTPNTLL